MKPTGAVAAFLALAVIGLGMGGGAKPPTQGVNQSLLMAEQPAATLQAYRLFADSQGRVAQPGMVPYTLNTPLFTDYAQKRRFIYLPPGARLGYRPQGVLAFPVGAVLVKTFTYPSDLRKPGVDERTVETRLLIHKPGGWAALTYVWNAAGTSAELKRAGARVPVHFTDLQGMPRDIDYAVPNVNQCKQCHSIDARLSPIGPKARNLKGDLDFGAGQ